MAIDPVSLAITAALTAASMAITASQTIEGPRLTDLSVTVADYGTPLNYFKGKRRLEPPVFYAEEITETRTEHKGKSGKYAEYEYFGTWANVVADHEIAQYTRCWMDRHLVFDVDGDSELSVHRMQQNKGLDRTPFRAYYGTEIQAPDERMMATVEAEEGVDTCPAYLGVAYVFFEDFPLKNFGNRFPQVSIEAITASTPAYPYDTLAVTTNQPSRLWGATFSNDYSSFLWSSGVNYEVWDVSTKTQIASGTWPSQTNLTARYGMKNDGTIYAMANGNGDLLLFSADKTSVVTVNINGGFANRSQEEVRVLEDADGNEHFLTIPWSTVRYFYVDSVSDGLASGLTTDRRMDELTGYMWAPTEWFRHGDGSIWAVGRLAGNGETTAYFYRMIGGVGLDFFAVTGLPANGVLGYCTATSYNGYFILCWAGSSLYKIDPADGSIVASRTGLSLDVYNTNKQFANLPRGADSIWLNFTEYSLDDLSTIRTVTRTNWMSQDADGIIYSISDHALWTAPQFTQEINVLYLDQFEVGATRVYDVMNALAAQVKMTAGDYDFSALDQILEGGYSWTQGKAGDAAAPLLEIHDSIVRPNGFTLEGVKRGGDLDGPDIREEWFANKGDEVRYKITITGDSDLPRRVFATFADINAEQQPNTAVAQRKAISVATPREVSLDLTTFATSASDMQTKTERWLRRQWIGSVRPEMKLTPRDLRLAPGHVRNLVFDNEYIRGHLNRMVIAPNRTITSYWERDGAVPIAQITTYDADGTVETLATSGWEADTGSTVTTEISSPGAEAEGRPPPSIYSPVDSRIYIVDTPLITDAHDQTTPFLYVLGGPKESGDWPGVDILHSDSGSTDSFDAGWDNVGTSSAATHGITYNALPAALTTVMDEGSELIVSMFYGTLESITDDQMQTDPTRNLMLVGDELVQFRDAVLQSEGEWICTGLRRGCQGTEQHIATHEAGERAILLATAKRHDVGAGEIGDTDYYQGITFARGSTDEPTTELGFTAAANKPLSPVHVELVRDDVTNDWSISFTRRSRIGGANVDGQDVPLGETSEAYKIRILEGASGGETVRTIETVTSSDNLYTAAQQTTDWGSPIATLSVEIVQMSPTLGIEGYPATAVA